jgi:hypothetical protein
LKNLLNPLNGRSITVHAKLLTQDRQQPDDSTVTNI